MTSKEKKVVVILIGVMLVTMLIVIIVKGIVGKKEHGEPQNVNNNNIVETNTEKYTTSLAGGEKINNSNEFNTVKKYKELEISNIQFTYQDGKSILLADIKNTSSVKYESEIVKLSILDENNQIIEELAPVLPTMEAGKTKQLNVTISGVDKVNAKDFRIEAK